MPNITKYNVYLSEQQARKVDLLSMTTGREPEQVVNEAVYGYLAIADPFAEEREPEEGLHEIRFEIPEEAADQIMSFIPLEGYDDLDEYAKALLLGLLGPQRP